MKQSNRGKAVILGIFLLALVLSGYAWWHQFQQSPRCREFFGVDAAQQIQLAPRVELLRFHDPAANDPPGSLPAGKLQIGKTELKIAERVDITAVPGLLHARHALLQDVNYQWNAPATDCASQWSFALRFSHKNEAVTVAFDPHCNRIGLAGTARTGPFVPDLMRTFAKKSVEWEQRARDAATP